MTGPVWTSLIWVQLLFETFAEDYTERDLETLSPRMCNNFQGRWHFFNCSSETGKCFWLPPWPLCPLNRGILTRTAHSAPVILRPCASRGICSQSFQTMTRSASVGDPSRRLEVGVRWECQATGMGRLEVSRGPSGLQRSPTSVDHVRQLGEDWSCNCRKPVACEPS